MTGIIWSLLDARVVVCRINFICLTVSTRLLYASYISPLSKGKQRWIFRKFQISFRQIVGTTQLCNDIAGMFLLFSFLTWKFQVYSEREKHTHGYIFIIIYKYS